MLVSELISRARDLALDLQLPYRTVDAEFFRWISDGSRVIVSMVPEANSESRLFKLTPSTYRQTLPSDCLRLLDVPRNMGQFGVSGGDVIRLTSRQALDAATPGWMSETGQSVEHYLYDFKTPRQFLIYPTPTADAYVEVVYSVSPPEVAALSNVIPLTDDYLAILLNYTVFRTFAKDVDSPTSAARAKDYYAMFSSELAMLVSSTAERVPASKTGGSTA